MNKYNKTFVKDNIRGTKGEENFCRVFQDQKWEKISHKEKRGDIETKCVNDTFPGKKQEKNLTFETLEKTTPQNITSTTAEVKTDEKMVVWKNAFIEISTFVDDKVIAGGPYRAIKENVDFYIHQDPINRIIYICRVTDSLIKWLENSGFRTKDSGSQLNRYGIKSLGYIVPCVALEKRADFIFQYDMDYKRTQIK